jgi:hypothetical protein
MDTTYGNVQLIFRNSVRNIHMLLQSQPEFIEILNESEVLERIKLHQSSIAIYLYHLKIKNKLKILKTDIGQEFTL